MVNQGGNTNLINKERKNACDANEIDSDITSHHNSTSVFMFILFKLIFLYIYYTFYSYLYFYNCSI